MATIRLRSGGGSRKRRGTLAVGLAFHARVVCEDRKRIQRAPHHGREQGKSVRKMAGTGLGTWNRFPYLFPPGLRPLFARRFPL